MTYWLVEQFILKHNYWIAFFIILIGLFATIAKGNFLKKLIGLNIFQTGIFLFYISLADVGEFAEWGLKAGTPPILYERAIELGYVYTNPLPHLLMLTGIVVSAATIGLGLALVVRMHREFGTIEEDEITEKERELYEKR